MQTTPSPTQNHLIAALTKPEIDRLTARMQLVDLKLGEKIYDPGQPLHYAYFPTTSIISLHYVTENGASAEAAGVGSEGIVGVPLFLGGNSTPSSAIVQIAGQAYRLEASILKAEFNCGQMMQKVLLRYAQALMTQMFQTAVCNRHHSVEQQLCRWLLLTVDRVATDELAMTQELVGNMLGVRRESITQAASLLQTAGCIRYRRGHIAVLDRKKLESRVCECYGVVKQEINRLMKK
ncbi:MAG TPA: Crp/Fnr family transcriptional regulator [Cellvibrionaceae bacterium]